MTEKPKSGWDVHDTFTDGQFDLADRFLAKAENPLELENKAPVDGTQYIIEKPKVDVDPTLSTAQGIIDGQEPARLINDGSSIERLTFPPLEGQEITVDSEAPEQMAANSSPFDKIGKDAFTKGPDRAPVTKPKTGFFARIFGGQ